MQFHGTGLNLWIVFSIIGVCSILIFCEDVMASDCWTEGYSADVCCGPDPIQKHCFDVVYTEELCCGTSYQLEGSVSENLCACSSSAEEFMKIANSTIVSELAMPNLETSQVVCSRWSVLAGSEDVCLLARLLGEAFCAHAKSVAGDHADAAMHAVRSALAAKELAQRSPLNCWEELKRLVDRSFPFSEGEAARNAERMRIASENKEGRSESVGWKRDWKPQLGSRTVLDDIVLKYRASATMQIWQKQFGCSGGDTGQDGNFYSALYQRIFDHPVVGSASMGPSRHHPARILEVGVCDGSGVAVWAEYFHHPESRIIALDININLFSGNRPYLHQKGFHLSRLSAIIEANVSDLFHEARMIVGWGLDSETTLRIDGMSALRQHGPYDFIRDDASHVESDMIAAFETLFPTFLRPCGVYVIEDIWSYPYEKDTSKSLDESGEYSYFFRLARDAANMGWRFDANGFDGFLGTAWIQSSLATSFEAWVDYVQFGKGWILIRKRCE